MWSISSDVSEELAASVQAMYTDDPMVPTAPLEEFLAAYAQDNNLWWRISCGHHQNLFEAALEAAGLCPE